MPTIIMKVDLECCKCNKKIRRVLCELQERWKIETIVFDEKNGTVTISGPFDAEKLCKKLCDKACRIIINIEIKKPDPPKPDPPPPAPVEPKPDPKPDPPPPAPVEPKPDPPPPAPVEPKPDPPPAPVEPKPDPPPAPVEPKPDPKPDPPPPAPPVMQVAWQYGPVVPTCCCMYHGTCRCCSCGRSSGWGSQGGGYAGWGPQGGGYECKTYELISEEDRSCTIM